MEEKTLREKIEEILDNHYPEELSGSLKNYLVAVEIEAFLQDKYDNHTDKTNLNK